MIVLAGESSNSLQSFRRKIEILNKEISILRDDLNSTKDPKRMKRLEEQIYEKLNEKAKLEKDLNLAISDSVKSSILTPENVPNSAPIKTLSSTKFETPEKEDQTKQNNKKRTQSDIITLDSISTQQGTVSLILEDNRNYLRIIATNALSNFNKIIPDTSVSNIIIKPGGFWGYGRSGRIWLIPYHPDSMVRIIDSIPFVDAIHHIEGETSQLFVLAGYKGQQIIVKKTNEIWEAQTVVYKNNNYNLSATVSWIVGILFVLVLLTIFYLFTTRNRIFKSYSQLLKRNGVEINELIVSTDSPIGEMDKDVLGFWATQQAIISVMNNQETEPPMSIVLSGDWGSGKSSMMRLIYNDLDKKKFCPIWFNAWHLQGESSFLGTFVISLMKGIRKDFNFAFRVRLFINRFIKMGFWVQMRLWIIIGIFVPILSIFLIELLSPLIAISSSHSEGVLRHYHAVFDLLMKKSGGGASHDLIGWLTGLLTGLASIAGILFVRRDLMPKIAGSIFELIPVNSFKLKSAIIEPGIREKFKEDFWDVIKAGNPEKRIVIFIDDLDRVSGKSTLELMETLNFISDAASKPDEFLNTKSNMFFVLAMNTKEVARNLGTQLKQITGQNEEESLIGARFLEKMVDLTITIPSLNSANKSLLKKLVIREFNVDDNINDRNMLNSRSNA